MTRVAKLTTSVVPTTNHPNVEEPILHDGVDQDDIDIGNMDFGDELNGLGCDDAALGVDFVQDATDADDVAQNGATIMLVDEHAEIENGLYMNGHEGESVVHTKGKRGRKPKTVDPNVPRMPRTAPAYYAVHMRAGQASDAPVEMRPWKLLTPEERQPYKQQALDDRERYTLEVQAYTEKFGHPPPERIPKKRSASDALVDGNGVDDDGTEGGANAAKRRKLAETGEERDDCAPHGIRYFKIRLGNGSNLHRVFPIANIHTFPVLRRKIATFLGLRASTPLDLVADDISIQLLSDLDVLANGSSIVAYPRKPVTDAVATE